MANEISLAVDTDKLVRAFESAPAKTRQIVERQVKMAVRDIREEARDNHRFISRSGAAEKSIQSEASGNEGSVWLGSAVAVYQHEGTRAHIIVPRNKTALRFATGGQFVFTKRVQHPGIKADPYLFRAAEKMTPIIISRFSAALDGLLGG